MSIMRVKVLIGASRTTVSLDPTLFRALAHRLESDEKAHEWIQKIAVPKLRAKDISGSSMSRQIQAMITSFLFNLPDEIRSPLPSSDDLSPL